jgi:hypothetical protein
MNYQLEEAMDYVGTTPTSGLAQLALLHAVGFDPKQGVLEIGCGALHLAKPLLMTPDIRYVGIDPNEWLREAALEEMYVPDGTRFYSRDDFYGWDLNGRASIAFAHSVLTHCSFNQLHEFMQAIYEQADSALVSVNLGLVTDASVSEWTYPDSVRFSTEDVLAAVDGAGWRDAVMRLDLRAFYMDYCPVETHDWIELRR